METDHFTAYQKSAALLVEEILSFEHTMKEHPNLLVLHASSHKSSNTFAVCKAQALRRSFMMAQCSRSAGQSTSG